MSFLGLRDRFEKSYRPFIGFDGYHLKRPFKSRLLSTVSMDAN